MAIFHGIPGGMDIHAGITEEGDPSREQWQEDEEPRIPQQSTSAGPPPYPSHLKREQKSLMKTCSQFIQLSQNTQYIYIVSPCCSGSLADVP